jgi:hypothetical protein
MDRTFASKLRKANDSNRCHHIKINGVRCASPAVRERSYCYFHQSQRDLRKLRFKNPQGGFELPLLEDANAIHIAVQEVAAALIQNRIDRQLSGQLLFALQIAQSNLRFIDFEPQQLRAEDDPSQTSDVLKLLLEELEKPYPRLDDNDAAPAKKPAASGESNKLLAG